jgi:hypothetical protein
MINAVHSRDEANPSRYGPAAVSWLDDVPAVVDRHHKAQAAPHEGRDPGVRDGCRRQ